MRAGEVVPCQARMVVTRHRCPYPARYIVRASYNETLVCGYHKRAWLPKAVTPLGRAGRSATAPAEGEG